MCALYFCKCGSQQFEHADDKIICSRCKNPVDSKGTTGFFDPSDSKSKEFITKLGIDIGAEAATLGAGALIGIAMPWTLPFTFTALGIVIKNGGETLSGRISARFFNSDSYGKHISDIFEKELKKIIKKAKVPSFGYDSFYNYHLYCSSHYSEVISFLLDNNCNTDIFSEDTIKAIVSEKFGYPGHEDTDILDGILSAARELRFNFEKKMTDNKDIGLRWIFEKNKAEQDKNFSRIIELLTSSPKDSYVDDDTYEYIKNYNRPLFLDKNSNITLGTMYLEPQVENMNISAIEAISDWCLKDEKLLFVYGAAGVGKTSLVTKIISDIYGISGQDSLLEFDKTEIHPVILRDKVSDIMEKTKTDSYSALSVIRSIISIPDCDLDGHLIILDGFDELCVLATRFDDTKFINKLIKDLNSSNIKIIITSRPMSEMTYYISKDVSILKIIWTESQIIEWCGKFSKLTKSNEEKEWCDSFKANYSAILKSNPNDRRLEMFSVPIILYLACKSNTLIEKDDSIGKFYDRVFRAIADRKHSEQHKSSGVYVGAETERINKLINWQFTKELAYQMFLNDTLTLTNCDKYGIDRIGYAKTRTIAVLRERKKEISENTEIDTELYLAVSYFAKGQSEGIEFAHKTVYEYFTALKLYEDYFACFNSEYFKEHDMDIAVEEVWNNIIEAFRYAKVSEDIFNYLNEMILPVYTGSENEATGLDYKNFEKCYIEGMRKKILSCISISKPIEEYMVSNDYINTQVCISFRNLTYFLTGHGFYNKDNLDYCKAFSELISIYSSDVNCCNWNLKGIDLQETNLKEAQFQCANLQYSDLIRTNLSKASLLKSNLNGAMLVEADLSNAELDNSSLVGASLSEADLRGCTLANANLTNAHLDEANLENANMLCSNLMNADLLNANLHKTELYRANLCGANLSTANINETNLDKAKYCLADNCKTIFPDGFDPKAHQMIEVDVDGNPI